MKIEIFKISFSSFNKRPACFAMLMTNLKRYYAQIQINNKSITSLREFKTKIILQYNSSILHYEVYKRKLNYEN
jgi:hypothetical protein